MFPMDVVRALQIAIQVLRRLKWLFVLTIYYLVFGIFTATQDFRYLFIVVPFLGLSGMAYVRDKHREDQGIDDFWGNGLFFRYGDLIYRAVLSIPVRNEWSFAATQVSATTLRRTLAGHISARLPADTVQVLEQKVVTDLRTKQQKEFTRVRVHSPLGSSITFFIHYAVFGHTITAQYFTFHRGSHREWDVVKFILASPLTIWIWGIPFLLNRYSITANISRFQEDSFDYIDLDTMYKVTHRVVLEETTRILRAAKLLTEEIERAIHFHINNVQNSQNIAINNSSNVNLGSVSQTSTDGTPAVAQQPLPA